MRNASILCAVDFSSSSRLALEHASRLAATQNSKLTIVNVYGTAAEAFAPRRPGVAPSLLVDAEREIARWKADAEALGVRNVVTMALEGVPWAEIVGLAEVDRTDLIVMGTRGRSNVKSAALGSVAERVARHAPCSVVVVR